MSPMTLGDTVVGTTLRNLNPLGRDRKTYLACFNSSGPVHNSCISWMASPSRLASSASALKTSERSLVQSMAQLQEWVEKKHNLASFMRLESWLKSVQLGLREANQMEVSLLLELDGPSCEVLEEVLSIDMLPHGSGKGCCLFGLGDHLGTGPGISSCRWLFLSWGVSW